MLETRDMTSGGEYKLILNFALPLMVGNLFQQLYTFVDTLVVGRVCGVDALAALGATTWLTFMLFGFVTGVTQGFSVKTAHYFGSSDYIMLKKTVVNSIIFVVGASIVITVMGQLIIMPALHLLNTPGEIIISSQIYLRILYLALPISFMYNMSAAILRALGNAKTPLKAMTIASLSNIVLDLIFVVAFGWGITGAAVATVIAQIIALIFCIPQLLNIDILAIEKSEFKADYKLFAEQIKIGGVMGTQNIITSIGGLFVQSVVNGFGVLYIAGYTAAHKLYGLLEIPASSFGYTMTVFAGQNHGAKKYSRVLRGFKATIILGVATALLMSVVMIFFGEFILGNFVSATTYETSQAIDIGYQFLVILSIFFPVLYIMYITRACLQGVGNVIAPIISSIIQVVMRMICAIFLTNLIGMTGIFYGEIFAWLGAEVILITVYTKYVRTNVYKSVLYNNINSPTN